jgi:sugar phosphate isomerase/epimerase
MIGRREFLKSAMAAAAAGRLHGAAAGGMYVSMNGSLTNGKPAWPDFARLAARVGFGGVDVNLGAAMKEGVEATRALFQEIKIRASNTNLPVAIGGAEEAYQAGMKKLDEAARFAAAIDCRRMLVVLPPSSQTPKAEYRKMMKDRLAAIGEVLRASNVKLGLEFLGPLQFRTRAPYEFIWRMDETLAFAKECGPNIGLLLDVWHWYHAGATKADIVAAGKDRIVHVHLSDCPKMPPEEVRDDHRVLPGEGVIDLKGFFATLRKIGYTEGVSPEPLGRIPKDMSPEEGAKLGLQTALAAMKA